MPFDGRASLPASRGRTTRLGRSLALPYSATVKPMCGVVGIFSWDEPVDRAAVGRAVAALRHRGPDGQGIWVAPDGFSALGHTRLGVIAPDDGAQPIASEDGQIQAVVNGEFYGFEAIRRELEGRGHRFRTRTDSEILVHLYEDRGPDCLSRLRGEFAFVLWDGRDGQLFAARDRFGAKPLTYAVDGERLLIASEAKALFAAGVRPAWDHAAFFQAAGVQYLPPDRTLFRGVRQLPPGHCLVAQTGQVDVMPYWDMDFPPTGGSVPDAAEARGELARRLEDAVRARLRADVPVCFHLSGGLDSSAVVGLAARHLPARPTCFTVSFEADGYDELAAARDTAGHFGAELHAVAVSQADLVDALPDAVYFSEGLAINGHLPAKYLLARAIRRAGFKVVLSGEGSDEVFGGYPHLRQDLLAAENPHDAEAVARLHAANPIMAGIQLPEGPSLPLEAVQERLGFIPSYLRAKGTLGRRMRAVLADGFVAAYEKRDPFRDMLARVDLTKLAGRHPVNQSTYLWSKHALAGYILRTLGDGTEMAHAVEGRLPFLDHELFEFAAGLPVSLKIRDGVEKYLLREAVRPTVTDAVYRRQKQAFTAPPLTRFGAVDGLVRDVVNSQSFAGVPFFDRRKVLRLLDELTTMDDRERTATDPVVMMVLSAALLHERYCLSSPL